MRFYDPTAEPRAVAAQLAPRLTSLAGKRAGILDNGKANAGALMLWKTCRSVTSRWSGAVIEGPARRGVSTAQSCWSSAVSRRR